MRLTARHLYNLYQPSECDLRVWLKVRDEPEEEPSEYHRILQELGARHERRHLAALGEVLDLTQGSLEERVARTVEAVQAGRPVLYQPVFETRHSFDGEACELLGIPDFLIREGDGYVIRDCKISRHADEDRHYETVLQLGLYGYLFERTVGRRPVRLEALLGDGQLAVIPYSGGGDVLAHLEQAYRIVRRGEEFYEPVGWSKCNSCGYHERCWQKAEEEDDVARVYGVDQAIARALHDQGASTVSELLSKFDEDALSEFEFLRGTKTYHVGAKASGIRGHARALRFGKPTFIAKPSLPQGENFAVFDIEGLPPHLDELEKIYLWGIQVFGTRPSEYLVSFTNFGEDGDRQGWFDFLEHCGRVLAQYGDIPFLHWHSYERTYLRKYMGRHGDPAGVAARADGNLCDLFRIVKDAIVLPSPTYSLKMVEKYAGFTRQLEEANGQWAMATYIRAVETEDAEVREELRDKIIEYNKEDLEGTWAVFEWLRRI